MSKTSNSQAEAELGLFFCPGPPIAHRQLSFRPIRSSEVWAQDAAASFRHLRGQCQLARQAGKDAKSLSYEADSYEPPNLTVMHKQLPFTRVWAQACVVREHKRSMGC